MTMENKIKLFEDRRIRYAWDAEREEWFFSAVDVCCALAASASKDPGAYWRKLKQRLINEGSEVVTKCHGLKLVASDGKMRETDCFTTKDTLRLIQSIPSPKAEPFRLPTTSMLLASVCPAMYCLNATMALSE